MRNFLEEIILEYFSVQENISKSKICGFLKELLSLVWKMWQYDCETQLSYGAKFQKNFKIKTILAGGEFEEITLKSKIGSIKKIIIFFS